MKRIAILIFFLSSTIVSFAQFPNNSTTGNASTLYHDRGGRTADGGFVNTRFSDTAIANTYPIAGEPGGQIIVGNTIYIRDSTATKWIIGGSSSASSITILNDSSISICNSSSCDTFKFTNIVVNNFTVVNDSTILVCDGNNNCDTLFIPPTQILKTYVDSIKIIGQSVYYYINGNKYSGGDVLGRLDGLISPGIVTWAHDSTFFVTSATYIINGQQYVSSSDSVTISGIDPLLPTKFLFIVDTLGQAGYIRGTPAIIPLDPQIDPSSQIALTAGITFQAGATEPDNIVQINIYDEYLGIPDEWAASSIGTISVSFNSTTTPYHLTKDINVTSFNKNSALSFLSASNEQVANGEVLRFFINLKEAFTGNKGLRVQFFDNSTPVSNALLIYNTFGLNPNSLGSYQNISIPLNAFIWASQTFNKVVITNINSGAAYLMDYIQLQTGINNIPPPSDYSNKVDSVSKSGDNIYYWVKGVPVLVGSVGSGNGIDSTAYHTLVQAPDSSYYGIKDLQDRVDTIVVIAGGGSGGGSSSGVQSVIAGDNITVDNTDPSNPIVSAVLSGLVTQSQLNDSTAAIRADFPSGGGSDSTTASNGLTLIGKDVQLGGTLSKPDTINITGSDYLMINSTTSTDAFQVNTSSANNGLSVSNTSSGGGINTYSNNGIALYARSANNEGIEARSDNFIAGNFLINPASTNAVERSMNIGRSSQGTASDGIGQYVTFTSQTYGTLSQSVSNSVISKWTNANYAARTSQFSITGVNNAATQDLLTLNGDGSARLNQYGNNLFTGTLAKSLGVDADGNIIEYDASGGGGGGSGISQVIGVNGINNVNDSTVEADTALLSTKYFSQHIIDSLAAVTVDSNAIHIDYITVAGDTAIVFSDLKGNSDTVSIRLLQYWKKRDSIIYYKEGNVAIGQDSATAKLVINGNEPDSATYERQGIILRNGGSGFASPPITFYTYGTWNGGIDTAKIRVSAYTGTGGASHPLPTIRFESSVNRGAYAQNLNLQVGNLTGTNINGSTLTSSGFLNGSNASINSLTTTKWLTVTGVKNVIGTGSFDTSAIITLNSSNSGFLLPRLTKVQRDSINLRIASVTIINGGTGYTSSPFITSTGTGTYYGASFTSTISGGAITTITVTNSGSFNTTPTIGFVGGGGSGAVAKANMAQVLPDGLEVYCTDCTATDSTVGVKQIWQASTSTWKNLW